MSPPQRSLHISQARLRAAIWPTQVGKTRFGAAEAWWHLTGSHPYRGAMQVPNTGWCLAADLRSGWPSICAKLREIEPPGVLADGCTYDQATGYTYRQQKLVKLANGSMMLGKGSDQAVVALSSGTIDWAWVDEPPKEAHYRELRRRLSATGGPVWLTLTPIGRPCGWLRKAIEGDPDDPENTAPEEPGWHVTHSELDTGTAPHRSLASIEDQKAATSRFEYRQTVLGLWDGFEVGRWIAGFTEAHIFDDEGGPAGEVQAIGLGMDHGERPGAQAAYLTAYDGFRLWVLGEYASGEGSGPPQHVEGVVQLLHRWGLTPHDVTDARGDTNSAGWLGPGVTVNQLMEDAFATRVRMALPPFRIQAARKLRGGVRTRADTLHNAFLSDRLRVHQSCRALIHSLRYWMGLNDDLKHPVDALGYIAMDYLAVGAASGVSSIALEG